MIDGHVFAKSAICGRRTLCPNVIHVLALKVFFFFFLTGSLQFVSPSKWINKCIAVLHYFLFTGQDRSDWILVHISRVFKKQSKFLCCGCTACVVRNRLDFGCAVTICYKISIINTLHVFLTNTIWIPGIRSKHSCGLQRLANPSRSSFQVSLEHSLRSF